MKKIICMIIISVSAFAGCGKSISDAQNYEKNNAPAITITSVTNPDGSIIDLSRIVSYTTYSVTVAASDPDNDTLSYSFSSAHGSFSAPTYSAGGCKVAFRTGALSGGQEVAFSVSVSDKNGGAAAASYDIGRGKLGPAISVAADKTQMKSSAVVTLAVTANCRGTFIVNPNRDGAITDAEAAIALFKANSAGARLAYPSAGSETSITLAGPKSPATTKLSLPALDSPPAEYDMVYNVWVTFADALGQADAVCVPIYVDDVKPIVAATEPADGAENVAVSDSFVITFSDDMNLSLFDDESLVIAPAGASVNFISYENRRATFAVSGLSKNVNYTASVSNLSDRAGNLLDETSFTFMSKIFVTGITLSAPSITTYVGFNPVTLTATVSPANAIDSSLTWLSSNDSIATVVNGVVTITATTAGYAMITATAADGSGIKATCNINVGKYYAISASNMSTLNSVMAENLSGHYQLSESIDLQAITWESIYGFKGLFDGNGKKISNLGSNFFNLIENGGRVANLEISGSIIGGGILARYNSGEIERCSTGGYLYSGVEQNGGLVGANYGTIEFCSSSCTVNSNARYNGGLVGLNNGTIKMSYATGAVNGGSGYSCGGLVGQNEGDGKIENCYARGSVNGSFSGVAFSERGTGGLVGTNIGYSGAVINSYATGEVKNGSSPYPLNSAYFGGLIGYNGNYLPVNCYYDSTTTKMSDTGKGVGRITTAMKVDTPYDYNWLSSVWSFTTNSYPSLKPPITE